MGRANSSGTARGQDVDLTERQNQVVRLITAGKTNAEIGEALGISLDGAKWHVSEILLKLDVSTREEAAEWWQGRNGPQARLGRALRAVLGVGMWKLAGGAAVLCVFGGVALALVLVSRGQGSGITSDPAQPPDSAAAAAASSTAGDGPVPFKLCTLSRDWTKPTGPEKTAIFTDRRFGDGTRPDPDYWAVYQSRFYVGLDARSRSVNKAQYAFNGIERELPPQAQQLCDDAELANGVYAAIWLVDHRLVGLEVHSGELVAEVEPDAGTLQQLAYPYPPVPLSAQVPTPLRVQSVRVVASDGRVLQSWGPAGRVEFDDNGAFRFAEIPGATVGQLPMVLDRPLEVDLLSASSSSPAAILIARDSFGQVLSRRDLPAGAPFWSVVATLHLEPGTSTLEIDGITSRDGGFVLLPADAAHP